MIPFFQSVQLSKESTTAIDCYLELADKVSLRQPYAQDMLWTCRGEAEAMKQTCCGHEGDRHRTCSRHAADMKGTCRGQPHAQNMQQT